MMPIWRRKISRFAGTPVAMGRVRGRKMENITRVSAVFLLVLGMVVLGMSSGKALGKGISARRPVTRQDAGVGTRLAASGDEVSANDQGRSVAKVRPLEVFREVEKGWRNGTPKPFERYLGKGKVWLDFGEGGPRGGFYTRGQAYYLITDYLRRTQTIDIGLVRVSEGSKGQSPPYARLERTCRYKHGVSGKEMIFVSLADEDHTWVISELRVVPVK